MSWQGLSKQLQVEKGGTSLHCNCFPQHSVKIWEKLMEPFLRFPEDGGFINNGSDLSEKSDNDPTVSFLLLVLIHSTHVCTEDCLVWLKCIRPNNLPSYSQKILFSWVIQVSIAFLCFWMRRILWTAMNKSVHPLWTVLIWPNFMPVAMKSQITVMSM